MQCCHLKRLTRILDAFYPKATKRWRGEDRVCSEDPCVGSWRRFSFTARAVVFNAPLLGNAQAQTTNTSILLKSYCGFSWHANKRGFCIWGPHFSEYCVYVLEDKTEGISGSFAFKSKRLQRDDVEINQNRHVSGKTYLKRPRYIGN